VYFDVVFGAFAFRDVSAPDSVVPAIAGTLTDSRGMPVANAQITITAGKRSFVTASDSKGNFAARLPGIRSGHLKLKSKDAAAQVDYSGVPVRVDLQQQK
jgi:hypothetical protein